MADTTPPDAKRHLAIFRVGAYTFCAPAHTISAITDVPVWTRIPKAPPSILGAVNHRGQVVIVVSLRLKLGLPPDPPSGRSQLIIAELGSGLTAFMVDEIEDVRPRGDMPRHPLTAGSAIDIFDAYLVDGERILLQTTFQKLFEARDTPPLGSDLKACLREAHVHLEAIGASAPEPETPAATDAATAAIEPAPEASEVVTPTAIPAEKDERHRTLPPGEASALSIAADRSRPATGTPVTAIEPTEDKSRLNGPGRHSGRAPWYRYAVIAALLLVMTVALISGVWLVRKQAGMGAGAIGPAGSRPDAPETQGPGASITGDPGKGSAAPAVQEETPGRTPLADKPETGPRKVSPQPPATEAATTAGTEQADGQAPARPEPPAEVLRIETETFTLTVERPGDAAVASPAHPGERDVSAIAPTETRHVVVPGDTLWDIAAHYLGDPFQYPELARLSRIRDPDLIYPDDVIRIRRRKVQNTSVPP